MKRLRGLLRDIPGVGDIAYSGVHGLTSALREVVSPHTFFEALGMRYAGPIDGHDVGQIEQALENAAEWEGPIVVHVLTQKGRGDVPAEEDEVQCLHDVKGDVRLPPTRPTPAPATTATAPPLLATARPASATEDAPAAGAPATGAPAPAVPAPAAAAAFPDEPAVPLATTYTDAFSRALIRLAEGRPEIVALTAAMPGPTGLLGFQARFPDRFFDVGIAEQHEVTAAAGMAMGGLRPVVAVYSTFLARAVDQMTMDVGLHHLPVVFALDRAGITGDNGPSHHGIFDLVLTLAVPGMTVFAPSSAEDLEVMLETALDLDGPVAIRFPTTPARHAPAGRGMEARLLRQGDGSVCLLGVGKLVAACAAAADELAGEGIDATVWDVRTVSPPDGAMLTDAARHRVVVTAEDGLRVGGAGTFLADAVARAATEADRPAAPVVTLGIPRAYLPHDKADDILTGLGLDGPGIAASVRRARRIDDQALFAP